MLLLSIQSEGLLWCILIAIVCSAVVHGIRLAYLGYRSLKHKQPPPPAAAEPKKEPEAKPEPVYFLVERKKKKPKSEYSEPKQINFQ